MKISECCQIVVFEKINDQNQTAYFCRKCLEPCDTICWNDSLSPQEELVIFNRFPLDRKRKKTFKTLAESLGKSVQRTRYLEKRAAMKILKVNNIKYKLLKKRMYDTLKAEQPDMRARWKDVFIQQYEKNKKIPGYFLKPH